MSDSHRPSAAPSGPAFSAGPLDRAGPRRVDGEWLAAALTGPDARFIVIVGERIVVDIGAPAPRAVFRSDEIIHLAVDMPSAVFLGLDGGAAHFAVATGLEPDEFQEPYKTIDLRSLTVQAILPAGDLATIAAAKSLVSWHDRHGFCANCGAPTEIVDGGWRRHCRTCETSHFPRTDPVVIMLAVDGGDCLLGRQQQFPPGMVSALAGFVEPGETIEEAVRRELMEEAGIAVGRVRYHMSQPWPFPSSLMIGCFAEALSRDIRLDDDELEDCRWYSRDEVRLMLDRATPANYAGGGESGPFVPLPLAIAHWLTRRFVECDAGFDLL